MAESLDCIPEYCRKATLILGYGNVLRGDDGFGPEVAGYLLRHYSIPESVAVLDAGMGAGEVLLDLALSQERPQRLVLVDAQDRGQPPGTLSALPLPVPVAGTRGAFSPHQGPTTILLKEIEELGGVEVTLVTVQPQHLPQDVEPGLSPAVQEAVSRACELIAGGFFQDA